MKFLRILTPALLLLLVVGCGKAPENEAKADGENEPQKVESARAVPVVVQQVRPSRFTVTLSPGGSTEAWREVDMAAQVGGTVLRVPHEIGDIVEKGDLLVEIDKRLYSAGVQQAKAGLLAAEGAHYQAQRNLERSRSLKENDRISDVEFEAVKLGALQAESGMLAARAALDLASKSLEDCEIRAPFKGRVAMLIPEVGEQVAPGMPMAAVVDLSSVLIRASISERDAVRIQKGMPVDIFIPALQDMRFEGEVHSLGVRSDMRTRSFPLEILVPNVDGILLSGMSARSSIRLEDRAGAIVIPAGAVVEQYGEPIVFTMQEGVARRKNIRLGMREGDRVEVLEGLGAGEELIVQGQWSVNDGTAVENVGDAGMDQE
ncbi:efflux RND transporter periplasmic adaptor subunit [bacterium]|nr:efflux RND transporter periplasmic adaptor subunit [bacterium]